MKVIRITCSFFLVSFCLDAQELDSSVLIILDPLKLGGTTQFALLQSLFNKSIEEGKYENISFESNDNIYFKMQSNYNFYDAGFAGQISKYNNDIEPTEIQIGDSLQFPVLPAIPAEHANKSLVQQINYDATTRGIEVLRFKDLGKPKDEYQTIKLHPRDAGMWSFKFKNRIEALHFMNNELLQNTGIDQKVMLIENDPAQLSYFIPEDSLNEITNRTYKDSVDLSYLKSNDFGLFYVLDEFDGQKCTHGLKVKEIIKSTFEKYNVNYVPNNIKFIPINFFDNRDTSIVLLGKYYDQLPSNYRQLKEDNLKKLKSLIKKCKSCLPEEFISSIFKYCYSRHGVDVISTSFVIESYSFDVVPRIPLNNKVMLVASSTNDSYMKIEDRFQVAANEIQIPKYEPLYSYYNNKDAGGIIVAALSGSGEIYGMSSIDGSGVAVIGRGDGWRGSCISETMIGTSFATPEIASILYIFRAYLRNKKIDNFSALEIKKRLILSSNLESKIVGHVGSAGLPSLSKLTILSKGYLVSGDDKILPCSLSLNSTSFIENEESDRIRIGRNTRNEKRISGIQFKDGQFYIFFEDELTWRKMNISRLTLNILVDGIKHEYDIDSFISQFKQLVILNN